MEQAPTIYNIQFSFRLPPHAAPRQIVADLAAKYEERLELTFRHCHNFSVVYDTTMWISEEMNLVYTVFHSGHVNVTGVRNFTHLDRAVERVNALLDCSITPADIKINNITASGKILRLNFRRVWQYAKTQPGMTFNYHPGQFPGGCLRQEGKSTVTIFSSGKYIIIGSKSQEQIQETFESLLHLVGQLEK